MSKDINIGLVGLGLGQTLLALNDISSSRFRINAVCDIGDKEKIADILKKWDVKHFTDDFNKLLIRNDIKIIAIFSPDELHYEQCIAALKAGKHIVCAKPLTNNVDSAIEIAKLAKGNKLKLLVAQTLRFEPQSMALKKFLDDGDLGNVIFAEGHFVVDMRRNYKRTPWRLNKKWLFGAGCHPIDIVRWFAGDIKKIHAFANQGKISDYPTYDNYTINIEFESGAIGRVLILVGIIQPPESQMKISIYGSKGSGSSSSTEGVNTNFKISFDKIINMPIFNAIYESEPFFDVGFFSSNTGNILRLMEHFEDCIINNKEPSPNAEDGVKTLIAAKAAQESVDTGNVIEISNIF